MQQRYRDQRNTCQKVKSRFCAHLAGIYAIDQEVSKNRQPIYNDICGLYCTYYLGTESNSPWATCTAQSRMQKTHAQIADTLNTYTTIFKAWIQC